MWYETLSMNHILLCESFFPNDMEIPLFLLKTLPLLADINAFILKTRITTGSSGISAPSE